MDKHPILIQLLANLVDKRFGNFCNYIDRQITRNLMESKIETRPVKSNGIWCCFLLPAILIINTLINRVSPVYALVTCVSLSLLFYGILFLIFISVSTCVLNESFYSGFLASGLVSTLTMYTCFGQDLTFSLIFSLLSVYTYDFLLRQCITKCPKTFTIGEAMVVSQSILLYGAMIIAKWCVHTDNVDINSVVVHTVFAAVGLITASIYAMPKEERQHINNLFYVVAAAAFLILIMLHVGLGFNGIAILVRFLFFDPARLFLFAIWLALVGASVCALLLRTKLGLKADTVTRKTFHVLASAVFLSGILVDTQLITLAAGVGFAILVLTEMLRKSEIEPISSPLQSIFLIYCDEKDSGSFAMTPLYLYCGLACPLILIPVHEGRELELLSGVLSIGVGDTAASWFGSSYGYNKWFDSNKSIEGTVCSIVSQVFVVYFLQIFDLLKARNALIRTIVAATISSLAEAKTEQIDNLVLPLVAIISFQLTFFLR